MTNDLLHDATASKVMAWSAQSTQMQYPPDEETAAEVDEPPESRGALQFTKSSITRSNARKQIDQKESLLTKALHQSDEDAPSLNLGGSPTRRRSLNSNVSLASTAELTSDTGFTSPARTNTPSPPPPVISLARCSVQFKPKPVASDANERQHSKSPSAAPTSKPQSKDPAVEVLAKKRCISFACGAKPEAKKLTTPATAAAAPTPAAQSAQTQEDSAPPRKLCIKFACTAKPNRDSTPTPKVEQKPAPSPNPKRSQSSNSPVLLEPRSQSRGSRGSRRSLTPRRTSQSPLATRCKKYLSANTTDLKCEASRFHAFASDEPQEDDWIRQNYPPNSCRLTISDTLQKENEISRLGKEAEEEALQEEEDDDDEEEQGDAEGDDQDDTELADDDILNVDELDGAVIDDDNYSGYGSDDDASDGYRTDEEEGFSDSDDEEPSTGLELWTPGRIATAKVSENTPIRRRLSFTGNRSDCSTSSDALGVTRRSPREKTKRIKIRPGTPELPDSTDFVCGTLDEDRPLEEAYISCIAARRRERMHVIPQDIDPSFPTSGPEDEDEEEPRKTTHDSDENLWIAGEIEDLHHDQPQGGRRKTKAGNTSPRRYHSPPPKRHHSPAPKARGRSPRRLFDRDSPRRLASPAPAAVVVRSPPASLIQDKAQQHLRTLAFRPGLTHTKSLPKAPALFPCHMRARKTRAAATGKAHVRGAIDIVKGLEQKRQRRKEKFTQKYQDRARKGQVHEKKAQPGQGAERMRELGLHMAGRKPGPDPYMLSI